MLFQRCKDNKDGHCYNAGMRNGLNSLECIGYDRCNSYKAQVSRIDIISQNGNCGIHYEEEEDGK